MCQKISLVILLIILGSSRLILSQEFIAGEMDSDDSYVEYLQGDLPLIISVPHGGYMKPDDIPERVGRFAKNQDIYTIEIAYRMIRKIHELSGKYPYVVINHLHRTRLDANRNIEEAANGNKKAEKVWYEYHNRIKSIREEIINEYGKGLFIDLHGHRHKIERIELGYALSGEELRLDEDLLNSGLAGEFSSIKNLLADNIRALSFTEVIRGDYSLGSLLMEKGQVTVPSKEIPFPRSSEPFFRGGYNISTYGSSGGGTIDGIQIEIDLHTRSDKELQKKVADDIARSLLEFLSIHYFPDIMNISVKEISIPDTSY